MTSKQEAKWAERERIKEVLSGETTEQLRERLRLGLVGTPGRWAIREILRERGEATDF